MTGNSETPRHTHEKEESALGQATLMQKLRRRAKRHLRGADVHGILESLPMYVLYSDGSALSILHLTIFAVNSTMPLLADLAKISKEKLTVAVSIDKFLEGKSDRNASEQLKRLFDDNGSDKGTYHNYHPLYAHVLGDKSLVGSLLEIGLGTNNKDVVSNMGASGKPGASLRAFRDYLPNANIYGADIDQRILLSDTRIETFYVDQTDKSSLESLGDRIPSAIDVIIDDGLHAPNANLSVLLFSLRKLGGWFIVEDIAPAALPIWQVIDALMPDGFETSILETGQCLMYVARKKGLITSWVPI